MSAEERESLINQVAIVISEQKGKEDYPYYHHFLNDCRNYGLDEEAFDKQILSEASKRAPHVVRSGIHCVIFGERCYTTEQMGEVFFKYPAKSEEYMEGDGYFKKSVLTIEDIDPTMELVKVFNSEKVFVRRYIKIVYHLNKRLPYRIGTDVSDNIQALLIKGFANFLFYESIYKDFASGYIQLWLEQVDVASFSKWNQGVQYNDFLQFIYAIDSSYPFYINGDIFATPAAIVPVAQENYAFRNNLYEYLSSGELQTWFAGTGKQKLNEQYNNLAAHIQQLDNYDEEELAAFHVQAMLQVIDPKLQLPQIIADQPEIILTNTEAGEVKKHNITLTLNHIGYVKAKVDIVNTTDNVLLPPTAIGLNCTVINFNSFTNDVTMDIDIEISPFEFVKDKPYTFILNIKTLYQTLTIPISIKVVFPKSAYRNYLLKYALLGTLFFVLVRFIVMIFTSNRREYWPYMLTFESVYRDFSSFYWGYLMSFIVMVCGLWFCYGLTKRIEKI